MHATLRQADRLEPFAVIGDEGPFLEAPVAPKRRVPWHLIALLVLTALAGVTRFYMLDRPGIWIDEAATFRRTSGSYDDMISSLRDDYFGPLFYEAQWLLRQYYTPDPFHIRLIPAIASLLFVPAMYFLARQVASIRTALVTALLTLCSAFMINYGRDAKMYMLFWLFVALSAGTFLWWLRTRTWTAWLCWIATSCTMMGVNTWGGVVLAIMPIWLLTARKVHWSMGLGFVIGVAVIAVGPVGNNLYFSRAIEKTAHRGHFQGIEWLQDRNRDATALDLIKDSASAFFFKFTFVQESGSRHADPPQRVLSAAVITLSAMIALMAIGALPLRRASDRPPLSAPEPWWRTTLWLGMWIVVPTYLFYVVSFYQDEETAWKLSPFVWVWAVHQAIDYHWLVFTLLVLLAGVAFSRFPRPQTWALLGFVTAMGATVLYAIAYPAANPLRSAGVVEAWLSVITQRWLLWPALVIVPGVAIARSGITFRQRGWNLLIATLLIWGTYYALLVMHPQMCSVLQQMKDKGVQLQSIWIPRYLGFIWPALAIVMASLLVRLPTRPVRWLAILGVCGVNLFVAWNRVVEPNEPPLARLVADVFAGADAASTVRTFVQPAGASGGPGAGTLMSGVGPYYAYTRAAITAPLTPHNADDWNRRYLPLPNLSGAPNMIGHTVKNNPRVTNIVVWKPFYRPQELPSDEDMAPPPANEPDPILTRLGANWKLEREELFPVRYHWSWGELYLYRRREYVKVTSTIRPTAKVVSNTP